MKKTNTFIQKIKRKRKQNRQRISMEKPVFRRIFLKRLVLFLCCGLLIGVVGTWVSLYFYRQYKRTSFEANRQYALTRLKESYEDLERIMEEEDVQKGEEGGIAPMETTNYNPLEEAYQRELLQKEQYFEWWKTSVHFNFMARSLDSDYQYHYALYDRETGGLLADTTKAVFVILPKERPTIYECSVEALKEAAQDLNDSGKENAALRMDDMYVKGGQFLPGRMRLVELESYYDYEIGDWHEENTTIKEYDFTPVDTAGYTHIMLEEKQVLGPVVWEESGSPKAKVAVQNHMGDIKPDGTFSTSSWFYNSMLTGMECVDGEEISLGNEQFYFIAAAHFNMFKEYWWQSLVVYAGLTLAVIILSLVVSYRTCMVEQGHFRMEQYRRETTNAMAHDLKTPLTAISGYAESLRDNVHPEKKDYYADAIFENVQHMNRLVENILELAKVEDVNRKSDLVDVDLRKTTENILKQYEILTVDKKLEIDIQGDAVIRADADMMVRAVENLISNVVKYALEETVVHVVMSAEGYEIRNAIKGELDVGAEELWKPFVKGSNSRTETQGTGIGLTIVKNIAELHGFDFALACEGEEFVVKILT